MLGRDVDVAEVALNIQVNFKQFKSAVSMGHPHLSRWQGWHFLILKKGYTLQEKSGSLYMWNLSCNSCFIAARWKFKNKNNIKHCIMIENIQFLRISE